MNAVPTTGGELERKRLDEWAVAYPAPTDKPFELRMTGSVFRGMQSLDKATEYADKVHAFWQTCGVNAPVFVVRGPTSTTKCKFEVVDATCGHEVVYKKNALREAEAEPVGDEFPRERG